MRIKHGIYGLEGDLVIEKHPISRLDIGNSKLFRTINEIRYFMGAITISAKELYDNAIWEVSIVKITPSIINELKILLSFCEKDLGINGYKYEMESEIKS